MRIQVVILAEASGDMIASEIANGLQKTMQDMGVEVAAITIEKARESKNDSEA